MTLPLPTIACRTSADGPKRADGNLCPLVRMRRPGWLKSTGAGSSSSSMLEAQYASTVGRGPSVKFTNNGADAVKYLKTHEYGVLFLDLLMPRIDGWGVIDYLRNRRNARAPKVFIVTGVHDQKLSSADQDIVSGLVYKPIDIARIEQIVSA